MATLTKPVVFMNMVSPEEPVEAQLVFVLALEQPKSQIEMLQEIARGPAKLIGCGGFGGCKQH